MNKVNVIKSLILTVAVILGLNVFAQAQSSKMKSLMDEIKADFPNREKIVAEKCDGAKVVYDVDFASFGDDYDALLRVPSLGLKESSYGIQRFCTDSNNTSQTDKAKVSALKSKVKTVRLKNISDKAGKKITILKDGTLLLEMAFHYYDGGLSNVEVQRILGDIL